MDKVNLDTVLKSLDAKLTAAGAIAQHKVLPGPRGRLMRELTDAHQLVTALRELARVSGVGERLGFINSSEGLRPAATTPNAASADSVPGKEQPDEQRTKIQGGDA